MVQRVLPFSISIGLLSLLQGTIVALPSRGAVFELARLLRTERLHSRLWALIPPLSVLIFVLVGLFAAGQSATFLTYLALVGVPIGAALALGWLGQGSRPVLALAVLPLFALAWADNGGLPGQTAAVLLSALSCVALGTLLGAVTPPRWLALGIVAMAIVDATLVSIDLLQQPNAVLNSTHPAAGLPRLQAEIFGSAEMGYGDLFVAGLLGGLLAATGGERRQRRAALLATGLALAFDMLFFVLSELPATVPVALALLGMLALRRHGTSWAREADDRRVTRGSVAG